MSNFPEEQTPKLIPLILDEEANHLSNNNINININNLEKKQQEQSVTQMETDDGSVIMPVKIENIEENNEVGGQIVNKVKSTFSSTLIGVGKYKIYKCPSKDGICYFLRCFWHLLSDPESDHVAHWHPIQCDRFIIPDDVKLEQFLENYNGFRMSLNSFRRSLYFYGFKKMKTVWFHQHLNNQDRCCLSSIKRRASSKRKERKLQQQYMQLMMAQMSSMQHQFYKNSLPTTNYSLGYGSGGPSPPPYNMAEMMANHAAAVQYSGYPGHHTTGTSPIEYMQLQQQQQAANLVSSAPQQMSHQLSAALSSAISNQLPPSVVMQQQEAHHSHGINEMQMVDSSANSAVQLAVQAATNHDHLIAHLSYEDINMYGLQHTLYDHQHQQQQSISPEDVKMNTVELMPNF